MRIGIFADVRRDSGGSFEYTRTLLLAARTFSLDDTFVVLRGSRSALPLGALVGDGWSEAVLPRRLFEVVRHTAAAIGADGAARRIWYLANLLNGQSIVRQPDREPHADRKAADWYAAQRLDLVLYPVRSDAAIETDVPAVVTVHDLNHRFYTEFPEVRAHGEFERREYFFRNVCRRARLVFVDSETGRDDLLTAYAETGITADRVVVLPSLPAESISGPVDERERRRVTARYELPANYLFYPAQFWPHKNHLRLVQALDRLRRTTGLAPALVFAGSYWGALRRRTFRRVMREARRLGVQAQIRYLGFAREEDMAGLYAAAAGLVMPTFFGPTNMPVLEAFAVGCPVLTSDIRGIREQTAGAAILVDPRRVDAMADGMRRLLTDGDERQRLVRCGREVLARFTPDDYRRTLAAALERAKAELAAGPR